MQFRRRSTLLSIVVAVTAAIVASSAVLVAPPAVAQTPGFDGSTIKIAGYGLSELPKVPIGVKARIKEFNDNHEIKGVKINFSEYVDDKSDPATALSEVRRLITQEQVFAVVPEVSLVTPPADFYAKQKVPVFGGGFTEPYCSTKPTTSLWLFGYEGCQVTPKPTVVRDTEFNVLKYVQKATGKAHPTVAAISQDNKVGHQAQTNFRVQFQGNPGWGKLVYNKAPVPDNVGDFSPYVSALATADNGHAPDFVRCAAGPSACLNIYDQLRAGGFKGEYESELYSDALVKPMGGSISAIPHHNLNEANNAPLEKMRASVEEVAPGTKIDTGVLYGYLVTDVFISALKKAAKGNKANITRENVQKAAATQTWQIKNLAGPTRFPASTVATTPLCRTIVKSDGTEWQTVVPFSCNTKGYKVK